MGLKIVKADDYAIRAMIHLACAPEGATVMRGAIARTQGIPTSFMAKILRSLVHARILASSRGINGGFSLARPPSEITLLEIVEAVEGPLNVAACVPHGEGCGWSCSCPAAPVWARVQDSLHSILGGTTLEMLVSTPMRNGRISSLGESLASPLPHAAGPEPDRVAAVCAQSAFGAES
jgi:Rrf2 family protein